MFPNRDMARSRAKNNSTAYQKVRQLFDRGGYDGFILDAGDISTLDQVSTGTTPVTAVTQPIGLMLDKHLGMQLGPELVTNGDFSNGLTGFTDLSVGAGSLSASNGAALITSIDGANYGKLGVTIPTTQNASYKVSFSMTPGTATLTYVDLVGINFSAGNSSFYFVASGANSTVTWQSGGNVGTCSIDNISIKLLDGNHPLQSTAPARPSWQVDANGHHYAQFLGTDDFLSCATGGGGSTGFLFCAALKPTGGAGTFRFIFDDRGTNTGYLVYLADTNRLSINAGNGVTYTTKVSTATADVGTTNYFTVKDDGTNLSVQIGSAAAETVARPVVVAGTDGYTIGKQNGAASAFLIADFYRAVYIKNWSGTAAQLAAIQSWVKAGAGL